jgi:hypothetical protein
MSSPFDYYLAIDVEGTCLQDDFNYFNEIIELPAVLINAHTLQVESGTASGFLFFNASTCETMFLPRPPRKLEELNF